jgi:Cu-processing system permease protein
MKTIAIAANTLREALRERLMYNLVVFALVLIAGSLTISELTLGEQFRIISDVATSATQLFVTLIAVFLGVAVVARELDRRTCYAVLARPVSRAGFVFGKYLGLVAAVALNVVIMAVATGAMLYAYSRQLSFLGTAFFGTFALILAQAAVCGAFAVLFSSFTTPTLASIFTLSVVGAGYVFSEARSFWLQSDVTSLKQLVHLFDYTLPNMGLLDVKEALTYGDAVTVGSLLLRGGYGALYAGTTLALAALVFSRRDVR